MADSHSKIDIAAAELSAEAAAKVIADKLAEKPASVVVAAVVKGKVKDRPAPAKPAPVVAAEAVKAPQPKPVEPAKAALKPTPVSPPAPISAPVPAPAPAPVLPAEAAPVAATLPVQAAEEPAAADTSTPTIKQLREKIMDTATTATNDFTTKLRDTAVDMQTRAKAAYEKGTEMTADVTAFHKGNFDAMVEAGKVLAAGMQDLGRTTVEDARSAAETATADVKALAAVKSPTELFQLQGEIARRNLDAIVAKTSKNAEVMMKLANEMFAPLSTRASVAMERLNKAA